jgi:hypothetical protein
MLMRSCGYEELLRTWSADDPQRQLRRIDQGLVHKQHGHNVFIARVEAVAGRQDEHLAELAIDAAHPYHFEHAQDHVPGMMLIEAGRQLAMAIAHLFYAVPFQTVFVLDEMSINFKRFAELRTPVFVHARVADKQVRREQLAAMSCGGEFLQDGEVLGTMSGRWTMFDAALMERLRRRAARGPAAAPELSLAASSRSRVS